MTFRTIAVCLVVLVLAVGAGGCGSMWAARVCSISSAATLRSRPCRTRS